MLEKMHSARSIPLLLALALGAVACSGGRQAPSPAAAHSDLPAPWLQTEASTDGVPEHTQRYPWLFPRNQVDRPDERGGQLVHYLYLVPRDGIDQRLDELGVLEFSIRSQMRWLRRQANVEFRLDTYTFEAGEPGVQVEAVDVTFVRSEKSAAELNGGFGVRDELIALGFDDPRKKYLAYVAGGEGSCGSAVVDLLGGGGQHAQVWLFTHPACRIQEFAVDPEDPSYPESTAVHEVLHLLGAVEIGAPHECVPNIGHVCTSGLHLLQGLDPEEIDVLFPFAGNELSEEVLDRDRDDYFGHPWPHIDDVADSPWLQSAS